ncbi:MAG: fibronectin type III-like domain-contianing protein [Thermoguttaceae bacterium]
MIARRAERNGLICHVINIPKLWMSDGPQGVREEMQANSWTSANRNDDFATALPACGGLAATFGTDLAKAFAYFNPDKHAWVAEAGRYTILVGNSSRNLPLKATFELPETLTIKEGS